MYQPKNGDTVTVTRINQRGGTWSATGVLSHVLPAVDSPSGKGGWRLTGTDCTGQPYDSYMSDASGLTQYGVTQTIALTTN